MLGPRSRYSGPSRIAFNQVGLGTPRGPQDYAESSTKEKEDATETELRRCL